jgi:hypothetical protein
VENFCGLGWFREQIQEMILSVYVNTMTGRASNTTHFAILSHPGKTNGSAHISGLLVEQLELWSNLFTGSALDGSPLRQELVGCFKKSKKTAI